MSSRANEFSQSIGDIVPGWQGADRPVPTMIEGRLCRIEPLSVEAHLDQIYESCVDGHGNDLWTYMSNEPFQSIDELRNWMQEKSNLDDPMFHALVDVKSGSAVGMAALMRINPDDGVIEIGNIVYAPRVQKTALVTEAMYLFMRHVFDELSYRRYEWKCDSLNTGSMKAAKRLGFQFEGIFRQAVVYKCRNRDTAWFSILDREWPSIKGGFEAWLDEINFDEQGNQLQGLQAKIANSCKEN